MFIFFSLREQPPYSGGTADSDNGSGPLIRIPPLVFWLYPRYGTKFFWNDAAVRTMHEVSAGYAPCHCRKNGVRAGAAGMG